MELQEIEVNKIERAILVALKGFGAPDEVVDEYLNELELLAKTAGAETIIRITQDKSRFDTAYYVGKGKAEEIKQLVELNDIDIIIFDDDLTPTQVRNLEKMIEKKIIDRSGLILDIFAKHARTNEAKTQVELAQLEYMLPRLTRAWTHLSKQYGGIGTKGPGETQIETDRRIIRTRIAKLKEKLEKIERQQNTKSLKRQNLVAASLVGYTNAGKSTLINLLTDADVLAEDKLFATLDSTTRSLDLAKNKKLVISDTVGFIRKLPAHLVASFNSTLNVVREADIILHVVDISHPFFEDHIKVVQETLNDLGCESKPTLIIFNKADLINDKHVIDFVKAKYHDSIIISASRGINIQNLNKKLIEFYDNNFINQTIKVSTYQSKIISIIYSLADVIDIKYEENFALIKYRTTVENNNKINKILYENK
ncbi:MAG TPA: GTPase HflX [Melioribacteraceae bacterium]|nr:GTPase HflX [Melioribacteraceae bacterium]